MKLASIEGPLELGLDYKRFVPAAKMDQANPPILNPQSPHNIGDWFVTKVSDRLLDYDEILTIKPGASQKEWDLLNSECDALVLKGGNYIQPSWLTKAFGLEMFKKVRIPIVLFGVGLQSGLRQDVKFEPEEIDILKLIHDSCAFSSLRGERTAEALDSIGISNTLVTGCPTLYWSRQPELSVRKPTDDRAGFSFRQGLYSSDTRVYQSQFEAIRLVKQRFEETTVLLQGEEVLMQHYLQATRWEAEFKATYAPVPGTSMRRLTREPINPEEIADVLHKRLDRFADAGQIRWIMENAFFSYDIGEYLDLYRSMGMVIGCRLHSNLLALSQGTPAYFLIYDERTREIAELFDAPRCNLSDFDESVNPLDADFSAAEKNYALRFDEFCRFFEANGLRHRLGEAPAPAERQGP